jgi:hypothetical protein
LYQATRRAVQFEVYRPRSPIVRRDQQKARIYHNLKLALEATFEMRTLKVASRA